MTKQTQELTRKQAIAIAENESWKPLTYRQRADLQLRGKRLCMPMSVFHEAVENALGRPVFTHEFGTNWEGLEAELFDGKEPPSFQEILDMIPRDKVVMVVKAEGEPDTEVK